MGTILFIFAALVVAFLYNNDFFRNPQPDPDPKAVELFKTADEQIIKSRMSYYGLLSGEEREKFLTRTYQIMNSLNFVSREEGFEVTDEMRVLISASMAQLTFGWTEIKPPHLEQIDLISESFFSHLKNAEVKGLTLPNRVILSWKYFQEGYQIDNDKINLGLHELAHSVWDETYDNDNLKDELSAWVQIANQELQKMQRHIDCHFFRDYAATNIQELWACSVECFFEAPVEFQQKLPGLYAVLADFINQDMVGRMQDKHFMRSEVLATEPYV